METYIHYGHKRFYKTKLLNSIAQFKYLRLDKPWGLWASPVNAKYGWKDWCNDEDYFPNRLKKSFKFRLKDNARILHIHSIADAKEYFVDENHDALNLKKIYANFDGMELHLSDNWDMRYIFYTWDVDSICIWNPDIIINGGD